MRALLNTFLLLFTSIVFSQHFRASLKSEKLNNESSWSEWNYNGALIIIKDNNTITVEYDDVETKYKVIKTEKEYSYDGYRCSVISFNCEGPDKEVVVIKLADVGINFMNDKKNSKYKLDRFKIYIHMKSKKIRFNVYMLHHGPSLQH